MNNVTNTERDRLVAAAKQAITLDEHGDIAGGFEPAWRAFQAEHNISEARARSYVAKAARLLRGESMTPGPGRPAVMDAGEPVTVYLSAAHVARANEIGDGNVSAGVRYALDACLF